MAVYAPPDPPTRPWAVRALMLLAGLAAVGTILAGVALVVIGCTFGCAFTADGCDTG